MEFGHDGLDGLFNAEPGLVTALVGKAGAGKTTMCMALAREAEMPFIVDTEGMHLRRMEQVGCLHARVRRVTSFSEQNEVLRDFDRDADLLVVDSLVMLYRLEEDRLGANRRLARQMARLAEIAHDKGIPVVVTGHVYQDDEGTHIVSGDVFKYWAKVLVHVRRRGRGREAKLVKHPYRKEGEAAGFRLCSKGIC